MEKLLITPEHQTDHLSSYEFGRNCKYLGVQGFNNPEMEAAILKSHTRQKDPKVAPPGDAIKKTKNWKNKMHASFSFSNS